MSERIRTIRPPRIAIQSVLLILGVTASLMLSGTETSAQELDPLGFERPAPVDSVGVLLDINNDLRLENDLLNNELDHTRTMLGIIQRPWYDLIWDSDIIKFVIFVLGVWLGAYAGG